MRIEVMGGGPAGLYFGILMKRLDPAAGITIHERNRPDDTFGFGVVFSDETLSFLDDADAESAATIRSRFRYWREIETLFRDRWTVSTGHGFAALARTELLEILQNRARALGCELRFESTVDDIATLRDADLVIACDGVNSSARDRYAESFRPNVELGACRFSWLGTTRPLEAFTFLFVEGEHGLFQAHAYPYADGQATFIVETHEEAWRAAGLDQADDEATVAFCERLFAAQLDGHRLLANRSIWRQFPTITCERWHHENVVLLGDAAHTAHFSIGSGTKLAMEDAIALVATLRDHGSADIPAALAAYQERRWLDVAKLQRAARTSREWFENSRRYLGQDPVPFTFNLMSRSKRITYDNLRQRDPDFVADVDRWFQSTRPAASGPGEEASYQTEGEEKDRNKNKDKDKDKNKDKSVHRRGRDAELGGGSGAEEASVGLEASRAIDGEASPADPAESGLPPLSGSFLASGALDASRAERGASASGGLGSSRAIDGEADSVERTEAGLPPVSGSFSASTALDASRAERATEPAPPPIFTPFTARGLTLRNRIVVSPMCQYSAVEGSVNDWHLVHLGSRAVGGAGLVIAEMTDVSAEGRITPGCAGMYERAHVGAWKRIVDFVHAHAPAPIGLQLAHAGRKGSMRHDWSMNDLPLRPGEGAWQTLAPSPMPFRPGWPVPREMTRADMERIRDAFARAASWANEAGFDWLELHAAHGYLVSSFLSPLANRRSDDFGGSLENRMRWPLEVFAALRDAWPAAKPMSVRVSATDWLPDGGGTTPEETVVFARELKALGCDLIDVSTAGNVPESEPEFGRMYQVPFAEKVRYEAAMPVMAVGAIQGADHANTVLAAGRADLTMMARPHLYNPYLTLHAAADYGVEVDWPGQYQLGKPRRTR